MPLLYNEDNLTCMKRLEDNSIQLIYSDILFGTSRDFKDFKDLPYNKQAIDEFYIPRIKEMYRVLNETGTLALQMDFRISHWVRLICDDIFGYKNCINVVEWEYASGGSSKNKLSQKNDTIIIYAKNKNKQKFNLLKEKSYNRNNKPYRFKGVEEFEDENGHWYTMVGMRCIWKIPMVGRTSSERVDYATQKPLKLMNRIVELYSNEDDLVADFFMGSGGFVVSANNLGRRAIGCDINLKAVEISEQRIANYKH